MPRRRIAGSRRRLGEQVRPVEFGLEYRARARVRDGGQLLIDAQVLACFNEHDFRITYLRKPAGHDAPAGATADDDEICLFWDRRHKGKSISFVATTAWRRMLATRLQKICVTRFRQQYPESRSAWPRHIDRKSTRLHSSHQCATRIQS